MGIFILFKRQEWHGQTRLSVLIIIKESKLDSSSFLLRMTLLVILSEAKNLIKCLGISILPTKRRENSEIYFWVFSNVSWVIYYGGKQPNQTKNNCYLMS